MMTSCLVAAQLLFVVALEAILHCHGQMNSYYYPYGGRLGYGGNEGLYQPSYGYSSPYSGRYSFSGYEGPYGGINTYRQPGISYPPQGYGGYGSMQCRDYSSDCAVMASTGQCATTPSTRLLCPLSCGTGCSAANGLYGSGVGIMDSLDSPGNNGGYLSGGPGYGGYQNGLGYGGSQSGLYGGYQNGLGYGGEYGLQGNGMPLAQAYGSGLSTDAMLYCRDSHVQGCEVWAREGLCELVPEYMLVYCRGSCGACNHLPLDHPQQGFYGSPNPPYLPNPYRTGIYPEKKRASHPSYNRPAPMSTVARMDSV